MIEEPGQAVRLVSAKVANDLSGEGKVAEGQHLQKGPT